MVRSFVQSSSQAHALATRDPHELCTGSAKRPDGVTQVPWSRGRCLACNAIRCQHASSTRAGSAAATAEAMKSQKYADITTGVDFIRFAIEISATWGQQAFHLVMEIGRRLATVTHEPRSTAFLRQRLSVVIQRGNAFCVTGTCRRSDSAVTES